MNAPLPFESLLLEIYYQHYKNIFKEAADNVQGAEPGNKEDHQDHPPPPSGNGAPVSFLNTDFGK